MLDLQKKRTTNTGNDTAMKQMLKHKAEGSLISHEKFTSNPILFLQSPLAITKVT